MGVQSQILTFILIVLFPQAQSFVQCVKTHRACPNNHTCSDDGVFCKQNGKNDSRSRWSLLENDCVDKFSCGSNYYCIGYENKCINRKVSICDSYLDAITITGCNNAFLIESFEACNEYYLNYIHKFYYNYLSVIQCADKCIRDRISANIFLNQADSCSLRELYVVDNYSRCYAKCGMCTIESTWATVFENIKKWGNFNDQVAKDFAMRCSPEYLKKKGKWTVFEIKSTAQNLIASIYANLKVGTSNFLKDVMALEDETTDLTTITPRFDHTTTVPRFNLTTTTSRFNPTSSLLTTLSFNTIFTPQLNSSLKPLPNPYTAHQNEFTSWSYSAVIVVLLVIICILLVIIFKKLTTTRENTEHPYEIPLVKKSRQMIPPVPRSPPPGLPLAQINFDGDNSVFESTISDSTATDYRAIDNAESMSQLERPIPSSMLR